MKDDYEVSEITLEDAESLIQKEHYLKELHGTKFPWTTHKFYGLFKKNDLVGAVQYCSYNFGNDNPRFHQQHYGCHTEDCEGFWEIARLAVSPLKEHNITSWFLSRTMKLITSQPPFGAGAKCIVSVADDRMHQGTIYAAANFDYYGLQTNRVVGLEEYEFHVYGKTYDKNLVIDFNKRLDK